MRAIFAILFIFLVQVYCSGEDKYVITIDEDNQLTEAGCVENQYGFGFLATTSGFTAESTFTFYCGVPYFNRFVCQVPASVDGEKQTISCWAPADIFPLLDEENIVHLPESLPSISELTIEGWENLRKELNYGKCSKLEPTFTFFSNEQFTSACDSSSPNNIISVKGSFTANLQVQKTYLTSSDEDYETYSFQPYLWVDGELAKANCNILVPKEANSSDEELRCIVGGEKSGMFFDTAAEFNLLEGTTQGVVRMKVSEVFALQHCESSKSSFVKLSALLLITIFLL